MGLRFPNGILYLRAAANINRATGAMVKAQSVVASGKNVTKISDDPSAATRIISLKRNVLDIDRYLAAVNESKTLLDSGASIMQSLSDLFGKAKELALQGANQTLSQQDREALADEIDGLLNESLAIANHQVSGRYLFSGSKTDVAPYALETISGESYAVYKGDISSLNLLISSGVTLGATIPGPQLFSESSRGATTYQGNTGAAPGSGQDTGTGNDTLLVTHDATTYAAGTGIAAGTSSASGDTILGAVGTHTITVDNVGMTISLDGGPAVSYDGTETDLQVANADGDVVYVDTTGITASGTDDITSTGFLSTDGGATTVAIDFSSNQKVVDSVTGKLLNVDSSGIVRTGSEYATFSGTFDVFTALQNLRDDLRNTRDLSLADQIASIADRADQIEDVHAVVVKGLALFGGRSSQLVGTQDRLNQTQSHVKQLLSSFEDADLAVAITEFTKAQVALEYSQAVASKVLQTSFMNFLS